MRRKGCLVRNGKVYAPGGTEGEQKIEAGVCWWRRLGMRQG